MTSDQIPDDIAEAARAAYQDGRYEAIVQALMVERRQFANCCECGRIVDTRETSRGGDLFGAQLSDGRWACSFECYEVAQQTGGHS